MLRRSRTIATVVALIIVLGSAVLFVFYGQSVRMTTSPNETIVATVDGEPIYQRELDLEMDDLRWQVFSEFNQKYGVEDSETFWNSEIHGRVPEQELKEKALQICKRNKVELIGAKQAGILSDISYLSFLKDLEQENIRRKEAVSKGQVIYGPQEYSERDYYAYVRGNIVKSLKKHLAEKEFNLSDTKLKALYGELKASLYTDSDTIKVMIFSDKDKAVLQGFRKIFLNDAKKPGSTNIRSHTFDQSTLKRDSETMPMLMKEAYRMKTGQTSGVIKDEGIWNFMHCLSRTAGKVLSFEMVKNDVESRLIDRYYERWLDNKVKGARYEVVG